MFLPSWHPVGLLELPWSHVNRAPVRRGQRVMVRLAVKRRAAPASGFCRLSTRHSRRRPFPHVLIVAGQSLKALNRRLGLLEQALIARDWPVASSDYLKITFLTCRGTHHHRKYRFAVPFNPAKPLGRDALVPNAFLSCVAAPSSSRYCNEVNPLPCNAAPHRRIRIRRRELADHEHRLAMRRHFLRRKEMSAVRRARSATFPHPCRTGTKHRCGWLSFYIRRCHNRCRLRDSASAAVGILSLPNLDAKTMPTSRRGPLKNTNWCGSRSHGFCPARPSPR